MADKILEREYVIPLRKEFSKVPNYKKTRKSITAIKEFISRHMKVNDVRIGSNLNSLIWSRGPRNPVPRVKVKTRKLNDYAQVELINKPFAETKEEKEEKEKKKEKKSKEKEMTQKEEDKLLKEDKAKEVLEKEEKPDVTLKEEKKRPSTKQIEEKIREQKIITQKQKPHKSLKK